MFHKISVKVTISIALILFILTVVFIPIYLKGQNQSLVDTRKNAMKECADEVVELLEKGKAKPIKEYIKSDDKKGYAIHIYNGEKKLVYSNKYSAKRIKKKNTIEKKKQRIERQLKRFKTKQEVRLKEDKTGRKSLSVKWVINDNDEIYYLHIEEQLHATEVVFRYTNRQMLFILIGYMVTCCIALILLIQIWMRKIKKIGFVAEQIAQKEYSVRYEGKTGKDEIGILAENINEMADTIQKNINDLKNYNFLLTEDLNYMKEYEKTRRTVLSNVTHELKTPLTIISSQVEMMKETKNEEKKELYYQSVVEEIEKMSTMITGILQYSLSERTMFEEEAQNVDIGAFIQEQCEKCRAHIEGKKTQFEIEIADNCGLLIEKNHIEHVFYNYLSNALAHVREQGTLRVTVQRKGEEKVRLAIYNEGEQIREEEGKDIWTNFFRGDKKSNDQEDMHAGLGLFIVKEIAMIEHAECGFENEKDGVTFWFDFVGK